MLQDLYRRRFEQLGVRGGTDPKPSAQTIIESYAARWLLETTRTTFGLLDCHDVPTPRKVVRPILERVAA